MVVDALVLYANLLADLFLGKRDIATLSRVADPEPAKADAPAQITDLN
jgi:hypothetical protein